MRPASSGRIVEPAALFRARTESSSFSRTSRMAIAMRTSLRCWFGAMRLLMTNYRMGRRALHVDPMAFSLKDRMLQRGVRSGASGPIGKMMTSGRLQTRQWALSCADEIAAVQPYLAAALHRLVHLCKFGCAIAQRDVALARRADRLARIRRLVRCLCDLRSCVLVCHARSGPAPTRTAARTAADRDERRRICDRMVQPQRHFRRADDADRRRRAVDAAVLAGHRLGGPAELLADAGLRGLAGLRIVRRVRDVFAVS